MAADFTWGDEVVVVSENGEERVAWVCSPPSESQGGLALVEYEDGSDEEVLADRLRARS